MTSINEIVLVLGTAPVIVIGTIIVTLTVLYRVSKKYPKVSRYLHKVNCNCEVCYPNDGVKHEQ